MGSSVERQKTFDCRNCQQSGRFESWNCFMFGDKNQDVRISNDVLNEDGSVEYKRNDIVNFNAEEVMEEIVVTLTIRHKTMTPLDAIQHGCAGVCPKGLIPVGAVEIVTMETFCRDYHVPPLGADVPFADYPTKLVEVFGAIASVREKVRAREIEKMREGQAT